MTISVPGVTETDLALLVRDVIIHFAPRMDRLENSLLALCFPMMILLVIVLFLTLVGTMHLLLVGKKGGVMTCSLSTDNPPWSCDKRLKYTRLYGDETKGEDHIVMTGTNRKGSATKKSYK